MTHLHLCCNILLEFSFLGLGNMPTRKKRTEEKKSCNCKENFRHIFKQVF